MTAALVQIKNLSIAFPDNPEEAPAIQDLNFDLFPGQCLGLVGESGSGKSMTALAMMQLLPLGAVVGENSQILFQGEDLLSLSEKKMRLIRGKKIGLIFQDAMSAFNPVLTVGEQLKEVLRLHRKLFRSRAQKEAITILKNVGIQNPERALRAYPHELSGGMRQRAMIGMTLAGDPDIIIADEPTTALDVTLQAQILALLKNLKEQYQKTLIFISHDLAVVAQLADHIIVMRNGLKVEEASTQQFFEAPQNAYTKKLLAAILPATAQKIPDPNLETLLTVRDFKVHFPIKKGILKRTVGYIKAVDGIDFQIPKGETLALVGESGSGKTTTGKAILKLIPATSGEVYFRDINLLNLNRQKMQKIRENMQIIFQDPVAALNPRLMIFDSICEGLWALGKIRSKKEALQKVDEFLEKVSLPSNIKWRYPHEFSGGQRQRICIARALALEPQLLILDEPTSALDVSIQKQILELLDDLQKNLKLTYLLITHNLGVVAHMAHSTAVMYEGKIVERGDTQSLLKNPQHPYTQQLLQSIPIIEESLTRKGRLLSS